jgi:hypothetical protein
MLSLRLDPSSAFNLKAVLRGMMYLKPPVTMESLLRRVSSHKDCDQPRPGAVGPPPTWALPQLLDIILIKLQISPGALQTQLHMTVLQADSK